MKSVITSTKVALFLFLLVFSACSNVDITNDQQVMDDLQGTWTGYVKNGDMYQHIRIKIDKDSFEGWVQAADSTVITAWNDVPDEAGLISISTVQENPEFRLKYRKFAFTCKGRCCGDKSLSLKSLSDLLTYVDGKGLMAGTDFNMVKSL
jgi:hypothetical protein